MNGNWAIPVIVSILILGTLGLTQVFAVTEDAKLTASDAAAGDAFGRSVAVSGDTVVVGSNSDGGAGFNSGSAYVFTRSGTTWSQQAKLTASDGAFFDQFGFSVAVSGDTIVVGAPFNNDAGSASGSAYIFTLSLDDDDDDDEEDDDDDEEDEEEDDDDEDDEDD